MRVVSVPSPAKECVYCCLASTETVSTIRDGEPRTATSIDFHTAPGFCDNGFEFNVALRPNLKRPYGAVLRGAQDVYPRLSHSPVEF